MTILGFRNGGQADPARIALARERQVRRQRYLDAAHDTAVRVSFAGHAIADAAAAMNERWLNDVGPRPEQLRRIAEALKDASDAVVAYQQAAVAYNAGGDQ